jgi:hypothetical protein
LVVCNSINQVYESRASNSAVGLATSVPRYQPIALLFLAMATARTAFFGSSLLRSRFLISFPVLVLVLPEAVKLKQTDFGAEHLQKFKLTTDSVCLRPA